MDEPEVLSVHQSRVSNLSPFLLVVAPLLLLGGLVVELVFHEGEGWIKLLHLLNLSFPVAVVVFIALDLRNAEVQVKGSLIEQFDYRGRIRKRQELKNIQGIEFYGDPEKVEGCGLSFKDGTVVQISSLLADYESLLARVRSYLPANADDGSWSAK